MTTYQEVCDLGPRLAAKWKNRPRMDWSMWDVGNYPGQPAYGWEIYQFENYDEKLLWDSWRDKGPGNWGRESKRHELVLGVDGQLYEHEWILQEYGPATKLTDWNHNNFHLASPELLQSLDGAFIDSTSSGLYSGITCLLNCLLEGTQPALRPAPTPTKVASARNRAFRKRVRTAVLLCVAALALYYFHVPLAEHWEKILSGAALVGFVAALFLGFLVEYIYLLFVCGIVVGLIVVIF